jgi:hypothetical protein
MRGKVLAVGPGERKEDGSRFTMDVSIDDTLLYAKYAGIDHPLVSWFFRKVMLLANSQESLSKRK